MPNLTPFVYPETSHPLEGSIADLMSRMGDPYARASANIGQTVGGALAQYGDPQQQMQRKAMQYQQTATKIAQGLVTPDGQQPTPDAAQTAMTKAGIPIEFQKPILDSVTASQNRHKENYADAAHAAYRVLNALPPNATDEDRAHAVAGVAGAASALGMIPQADVQKVIQQLASGGDPKSMALGLMAASPAGRYKDIIQDETKAVSVGRGGLYLPGQGIVGAPPAPAPKAEAGVVYKTPDGVEHPVTIDNSGKYIFNGQDVTGQVTRPTPEKTESAQTKSLLLDGKPTELTWEPKTKQWLDANNTPIQNAATRIKPIPTAAENGPKPKSQDDLEQEYRGLIAREFSSRSGGMGMEDGKVDMAIHSIALMDQYEGKNMPAQIHAELALNLARLTSPNGNVGIELEKEFKQKTAQEGVAKAVAWLTGDPQLVNATPEALRDMLRDSIERQGRVAQNNRQSYFDGIKAAAPTQLDPKRKTALEGALKLNRMPAPKGSPPAGTQRNGATWQDGPQGWGWYK